MENQDKDLVVFYGPLPVNKPYPIVKPNERIQLQPTVNPVAITPYISVDDDTVAKPADITEDTAKKGKKRASARIGGFLMFVVGVLSILLFAFGFLSKFPIASLEKVANLQYFDNGIKSLADFNFKTSFAPLLMLIGFIAIMINTLMSFIAILSGYRRGYTFLAFFAFLLFVVASFYEMRFFSEIKNLGNLLTRDSGWPCLMLMIIGAVNLAVAVICSAICPKHPIVEAVEF